MALGFRRHNKFRRYRKAADQGNLTAKANFAQLNGSVSIAASPPLPVQTAPLAVGPAQNAALSQPTALAFQATPVQAPPTPGVLASTYYDAAIFVLITFALAFMAIVVALRLAAARVNAKPAFSRRYTSPFRPAAPQFVRVPQGHRVAQDQRKNPTRPAVRRAAPRRARAGRARKQSSSRLASSNGRKCREPAARLKISTALYEALAETP
jgi:hypothetical protein